MLTISFAAIEAARAAAAREDRSLSNYTSVLYELAGRVRLADIERLAAAAIPLNGNYSSDAGRRRRETKRAVEAR